MSAESFTFTVDNRLPSLVINFPTCGHCGKDVQTEDSYAFCETCRVQWDGLDDGAAATPDPNEEGTDVPCALVLEEAHRRSEYDHAGKHWSLGPYQPCILPSGHEGDHLNPHTITSTPIQEQQP